MENDDRPEHKIEPPEKSTQDRSAERQEHEERNAFEAEQNRFVREDSTKQNGLDQTSNSKTLPEADGDNQFKEMKPLEGITPRYGSNGDWKMGESIAIDHLAKEYSECQITKLNEHSDFPGLEGNRPDVLVTDSENNPIAVAEIKTHSGDLSNDTLDTAYKQLVNGADYFGVDQTSFVTINENGMIESYHLHLDELKNMGKSGFREYVRNKS